jgi:hypothetical protein
VTISGGGEADEFSQRHALVGLGLDGPSSARKKARRKGELSAAPKRHDTGTENTRDPPADGYIAIDPADIEQKRNCHSSWTHSAASEAAVEEARRLVEHLTRLWRVLVAKSRGEHILSALSRG